MNLRVVIATALAVQALCATVFVADILSSIFNIRSTPIPWQFREALEIGAGFGLVLGVVLGAYALRASAVRQRAVEEKLRLVSSTFMEMLDEFFQRWDLTPAERDVALFMVKGLGTAEIAALRQTSEGTVKAQSNAIYRKAGVSGRAQLLSLFIDGLIEEDAETMSAAAQ